MRNVSKQKTAAHQGHQGDNRLPRSCRNRWKKHRTKYAYDLNGNLLTDGTRCFAYDDENQLISVWKTNVWRNDYVYDGKMRRRIEKDFGWNGSAWCQTNEIRFIYDGNLVVQERNTTNQPLVEYTRGNDLSGSLQGAGGIGGLLARSQDSLPPTPFYVVSSYYHADGNGNVTMLIDASQTVVAKYLYDPFGNILAQSGLLVDANSYRFSSKEWNQNSGLYYYLYRHYDSSLQRWINRDPVAESGFERLRGKKVKNNTDINIHEFVLNNPINMYDSFGLDIDDCLDDCDKEKSKEATKEISNLLSKYCYIHIGLGIGNVAALLSKSSIAVLVAMGLDVVDASITAHEIDNIRKTALANWKQCCTDCGVKWNDIDEAKKHISVK